MKKTIFIIGIFFISGILIYVSFLQKKSDISDNININELLSQEARTYSFSENKNDFILTDSTYGEKTIFYKKINSIDGVYYMSKNIDPIKIEEEQGGKTIITVKEGIYLFVLNDIFNKYEVKSENLNILQQGKGLFLLNNISDNFRVFSYNSILKISLIETNKIVTSFDLLPSLLFLYYTSFNKDLKDADILRISTIDNIYYLDIKRIDFAEKVFGNKEDINTKFLQIASEDFKNKIKKFNIAFNSILNSFKGEVLKGEALILAYPKLFINDLKKETYLKNELTKELISYLKILLSQDYKDNNIKLRSSLIKHKNNIASILKNIKGISSDLHNEGINIIKNYYYLSYFSNILNNDDNILNQNDFLGLLNDVFGSKIKGNDYFGTLSDVYFSYNLGTISKEKLNSFINIYLQNLLKNKVLKKEDYFIFSFFLIQYINGAPYFSQDILSAIIYLFQMTDNYYSMINDIPSKSNILSINFFNFSKIITGLNNNILKTFFKKGDKGFILKDEYSSEYGNNFPKEILDNLKLIYQVGTKDQALKKVDFYKFIQNNTGNIKENYVLLEEKFNILQNIIYIISNYSDYLLKLTLNEQNKQAVGLSFDDSEKLSKESLTQYLSQFNNLDVASIRILNNYEQDGFYNVSVNIFNNKFKFNLNPKGNTIFNLVYIDTSGKEVKSYQNLPISLDEKNKILSDKCKDKTDYMDKYKCDFKNIFEIIYLMNDSNNSVIPNNLLPDTSTNNKMTVEMQIFVQDQLINKDFKNISNFLNIGFKNIFAKVNNGEYDINLTNINKMFTENDNTYNIEISGKYIFKTHSFYNLTFKLKQENTSVYDLDGISVKILPSTIFIKNLESKMKNLTKFISFIKANYKGIGNSIKIDLDSNNIYINSEVFNININNLGRNSFQ